MTDPNDTLPKALLRAKSTDGGRARANLASAPASRLPSLQLPEDLSIDEWGGVVAELVAEGADLLKATVVWCFRVGDAANYGERRFGIAAKELINELGLSYWQVAKFASVARRVPPENRRLALNLEHHRNVAGLSPELQASWLSRAEDGGWAAARLKTEMIVEASNSGGSTRVFGPPLDFRGLRHEPINEQGVVFLFGMVADELGFLVEAVTTGFPDCTAKRLRGRNRYESVRIEFEFKASTFYRDHKHDPAGCDILVCWINDWPDCPIEVIELSRTLQSLQAKSRTIRTGRTAVRRVPTEKEKAEQEAML